MGFNKKINLIRNFNFLRCGTGRTRMFMWLEILEFFLKLEKNVFRDMFFDTYLFSQQYSCSLKFKEYVGSFNI